jgi:hypothetical protein
MLEKARLKKWVEFMRGVEMAVVVSAENGEEEKFAAQGLAIQPHRERLNRLDAHGHDIEYNFKDPDHPLQLVFVCAMWLTGFDAPTFSTLYIDKPMQGPHADADHRPRQSGVRAQDRGRREEERGNRRLLRGLWPPEEGPQGLWRGR